MHIRVFRKFLVFRKNYQDIQIPFPYTMRIIVLILDIIKNSLISWKTTLKFSPFNTFCNGVIDNNLVVGFAVQEISAATTKQDFTFFEVKL